jgi:ceramide glucosyltransferase
MDAVQGALIALETASAALYLTMISGFLVAMRRRTPARAPQNTSRVSILKPLAGVDDELDENLSSFETLDYPDYEIVLGVASVDDDAYALAREFVDRVGPRRARLIVTDPNAATNPKVAQLIALEQAASGEVVVVSDSNVRVAPAYLDSLLAELSSPGVGVASSLVAGTGERTLGAAMENLQLGAVIAPGIAASALVLGKTITLGKSMAMWREPLRSIGGFARVAHVLSDDHVLGKAFEQAGYKVRVSLWPVENRNVDCSLERTIERHTRWAQTRRALAPVGFVFEPALSPVVIATLACVVEPTRLFWLALLSAVVVQIACAAVTTRTLRGAALRWYWAPLEIARSYLLFFCWLRACISRRVNWRGHRVELVRDSAIVPAEPRIRDRVRGAVREPPPPCPDEAGHGHDRSAFGPPSPRE